VVRACLALVAAGLVVACSSSGNGGGGSSDGGSSSGGSSSGGGDASNADDSGGSGSDASGVVNGEGGTKETACFLPPYVAYSATLSVLGANGGTTSPQGVRIGFSTCTGFEVTTDATGNASTQLTQGAPVTPFYTSSAILSMLGAEIPATDNVAVTLTAFQADVLDAVPGFAQDGGEAALVEVVLAVDPSATGACASTSGVSLAVTGHPEATVSYMAAGWPTDTTVSSTVASADGTRAFIGGIVGASKVAITGAKSGCTVNLVTAAQTGSFALLAGSITVGTATITD
jgi:hypothetical protein